MTEIMKVLNGLFLAYKRYIDKSEQTYYLRDKAVPILEIDNTVEIYYYNRFYTSRKGIKDVITSSIIYPDRQDLEKREISWSCNDWYQSVMIKDIGEINKILYEKIFCVEPNSAVEERIVNLISNKILEYI